MIQPTKQLTNILQIYNSYRLLVSVILLAAVISKTELFALYIAYPQALLISVWIYFIINLLLMILPISNNKIHILGICLFDISLLSIIFGAAGGIPSGTGNLLIVTVAINNIMLVGTIGFAIAALAACALVYITFFLDLHLYANLYYVHASVAGSLCFLSAFFMQNLAKRLQKAAFLAQYQAKNISELEEINSQILQRLEIGCLLLDKNLNIKLANKSANKILSTELNNNHIKNISIELYQKIQNWQHNPTITEQQLSLNPSLTIAFTCKKFDFTKDYHILLFIEDLSRINNKANELKQKSLAAMAGSIAHEIRNPLGAISYATQLLNLEENTNPKIKRFIEIITNNTTRMNNIVDNIIQITEHKNTNIYELDLSDFIKQFVDNYQLTENQQIHLFIEQENIKVLFDKNQLHQTLTNLVQNGLHFSALQSQQQDLAQVWIRLKNNPLTTLEIIDNGCGIKKDDLNKIFEPFFSTRQNGSGLGLYVCKELCNLNGANLSYLPHDNGGSCFKITFASQLT